MTVEPAERPRAWSLSMHRFRWAIVFLASLMILSSFPAPAPAHAEVLAPNWVIYDMTNQEVIASLTKLLTGLPTSGTLSPVDEATTVRRISGAMSNPRLMQTCDARTCTGEALTL